VRIACLLLILETTVRELDLTAKRVPMPSGGRESRTKCFRSEELMLIACISAASVVGLVIIALLIMTRAVTIEQVTQVLGRGLLVLIGVLIALCMFRAVLASVVIPWFLSLKSIFGWLAVAVLVASLAILIARIALSKFQS
jgi:hypothetical protein